MTDRRVTVKITEDEHAAWTSAAREQGIPLGEFVRRASNQRSIDGAPLVDAKGNSARQLRRLVRHYTRILNRMSDGELGLAAGITCMGCHGIFSHVVHHVLGSAPL